MKILIGDDDAVLVSLLQVLFSQQGFQVLVALDGEIALKRFGSEEPDVVILDLKMPKRTGLEVLKHIRDRSEAPVIILTVTRDEDTIVKLLELGADDYVIKPFQPRELVARVKALVRRSRSESSEGSKMRERLQYGDLSLDPIRREVTVKGQPVRLTRNEFRMLKRLMQDAGKVVSVEELMTSVWGYESDTSDEVVRVTILRLRRKIESNPSAPRYILSVPGGGYMCEKKS